MRDPHHNAGRTTMFARDDAQSGAATVRVDAELPTRGAHHTSVRAVSVGARTQEIATCIETVHV